MRYHNSPTLSLASPNDSCYHLIMTSTATKEVHPMRNRLTSALSCIFIVCSLAGCRSDAQSADEQPESSAPASAAQLSTQSLINSENPVLELIASSHAGNSFTSGTVPKEDIELILSAGSKAQSAKNAQPWHFAVVMDDHQGAVKFGSVWKCCHCSLRQSGHCH